MSNSNGKGKITSEEAKKNLSAQVRTLQEGILVLTRLSESLDRTLKSGDIAFTVVEDAKLAEKNFNDCKNAIIAIKKTGIARVKSRASEL